MPLRLPYRSLSLALFLLWGLSTLAAQPSNLRVERLGAEDGIPMGNFDVVIQDSKGFIWAGGYAGLIRYDGYEAIHYVYDAGDSLSIGDNKVTSIAEAYGGDGLWIGTQNGLNYFDRKTETFTRFLEEQNSKTNSKRNYILNLCAVDSGVLWIVTRKGIGFFEPNKGLYSTLDGAEAAGRIYDLYKGLDGVVWVGAAKGLFKTISTGKNVERVTLAGVDSALLADLSIHSITESPAGTLWLGSSAGIIRYDVRKGNAVHFSPGKYDFGTASSIMAARNGLLWWGTQSGLFRFDPTKGKWQRFQHERTNDLSLSSNSIQYIQEDNTGIIWVATVAGLNVLRPSTEVFHKFLSSHQYEMSSVSQLRSFFEIAPGKILRWEKTGLMVFDRKEGTLSPFPYRPAQNMDAWNTGVYCFFKDQTNRVWMGTHGGVFAFDPATKAFAHYYKDSGGPLALSSDFIRDICQDHTGAIWIATWDGGVNMLDEHAGKVSHYFVSKAEKETFQYAARRVFVDRKGTVWVGTRGGLHQYDRAKDRFTRYYHDPQNPASISENTAFDIYEDNKEFLWIGTYGGGLNRFDPNTKTFKSYTTNHGLPDNNVFSILPDRHGNLWLNTYTSIVQFDPQKETFKILDHRDGLLNKQFDAFSHYQSPWSGELMYEGKQGIDIFHPDSIRLNLSPPVVRFTDFLLFNRPVPVRRKNKNRNGYYLLDQSITETKKLTLPYRMKVLTFKFAALHYANPDKNQYAYYLEGFDSEWQYIGNRRTVTFTSLPHGTYLLRVKASNANGVWSDEVAQIELVISPPWWLTWGAFGAYALTAALLFYAFFHYQRRRWRLQAELAERQREATHLKELDAFRKQLFDNVTHEFRTPLTVIIGIAEKLLADGGEPVGDSMHRVSTAPVPMELIQRNGYRLLQIVNQILDLSKLEAGLLPVNLIQADAVALLYYLSDSYQSLADAKHITMTFDAEPPSLLMDVDEEKLTTLFSNLLSNAVKFTGEGGNISIRLNKLEEKPGNFLRIEINDTGIGIPQHKLAHIFDRFYQVDSDNTRHGLRRDGGTGIGLTLSKEFIELLGGKIEVESTEGSGSCFRVYLPVTNDAPMKQDTPWFSVAGVTAPQHQAEVYTEDKRQGPAPDENRPTLLIVEDSPDIVTYLRTCLEEHYEILSSSNGRLGVEKAVEEVPNIIISDVMMPEMDGFELCEILKNDERTSHIPIVLLTARADAESRLKGLSRGADAYLAKPFHMAELQFQLANISRLQQKLRARYQTLTPPPPSDDPGQQIEDQFLRKARQIVFEHLTDPDFSVPELYRTLGVSRTQLHNKLKALTGNPATTFIRLLRLQHSRELLRSSAMSVSEIAYAVGFNDPNYFSRCFQEEYGHTPSEEKSASQRPRR